MGEKMEKCYICGDKAKGECIYCLKKVCAAHLTLVGGNSVCSKCLHRSRRIGLICGIPTFIIVVIVIIYVLSTMGLLF